MKTTFLNQNIYQGIRSGKKPNKLTILFYNAKLHQKENAKNKIVNLAAKELKDIEADYITAVNTTISEYNLPLEIAREVSKKINIPFAHAFTKHNLKRSSKKNRFKGKKIIVIDDVIFTGQTLRKVQFLLREDNAKEMIFYAFLKSPNYK